ncbi:MAG: phage holin family protein [Opitutaceae bacterium]|nr:phage holin family protein [Opitutaceae bacterium]
MKHPIASLLIRWIALALGVGLSAKVVPGISCADGVTLLFVVIMLSVFNAFLKPLLVIFTLPFVLLSLGIGVWLINALLFLLVARMVDGFHVAGFGSALLGALIVSVTNMALTQLLARVATPPPPSRPKQDDVIDI